ncbi:cell division protein [Bernardetia litoralis DSM 6794]|uniref:Cell division protein n=1 Tax=Bernardetia litoralis (strain ATCC 23117 / DSM 6794 / NBRC 15988 / NCIMB 1366 / Fx l1 / Sio-4) TaxID=880071 RepID=I4AMJ3_BERLS|nr:SPOR domain-containing protein [Bernardetia litoralis]AFM05178.1 cell division protein [Bernardetia litoralis DSM 6794]
MIKKYFYTKTAFIFGFLCLFASNFASAQQVSIPEDVCMNGFEQQLYALIDTYRSESEAHTIQVSKKLTFVAKLHARDLYHNRIDKDSCSMQSWSDKGFWSACCFSERDNSKQSCMWDKPKEITGYAGKAYEVIYNGGSEPKRIMELWKGSSFYSDILKNSGRYADKDWAAVGIGQYKNVTVVWFGEVEDEENEVQKCSGAEPEYDLKTGTTTSSETIADNGNDNGVTTLTGNEDNTDADAGNSNTGLESGKFYLIYGSYSTQEYADAAVRQLSGQFPQARVITTSDSDRYRIALYEYSSKEEARNAQNNLDYTYVGAWVLAAE